MRFASSSPPIPPEVHDLRGTGVEIPRPCLHELAALVEEVRGRVGCFGPVGDGMREGGGADLGCEAGPLLRPHPTARPEPVRGRVDPEALQALNEGRVAKRHLSAAPGKDEPRSIAEVPRVVEDRHGSGGERHAVLAPPFIRLAGSVQVFERRSNSS